MPNTLRPKPKSRWLAWLLSVEHILDPVEAMMDPERDKMMEDVMLMGTEDADAKEEGRIRAF
jgi:hypothetical protein